MQSNAFSAPFTARRTSLIAFAKKSKGSDEPPPRITSNVKQNLQFLKLLKLHKQKQGQQNPSTRYRRKKEPKEILNDDLELYQDPTTTLYYTNQGFEEGIPVLLVDGYNVCGYWAKLKKHFINGRLDIARQKLIDDLITYSAVKDVKVVVVFDAMMSGQPTHKETFAGIDIVFTSELCADSWIENEVASLREDGCPTVWVATSDNYHRQVALLEGAFVWSCKALISEINAANKEADKMFKDSWSTSMQGKLLKHNLDPAVVSALQDLKRQLEDQASQRPTPKGK